jgi:hypothetical protein
VLTWLSVLAENLIDIWKAINFEMNVHTTDQRLLSQISYLLSVELRLSKLKMAVNDGAIISTDILSILAGTVCYPYP